MKAYRLRHKETGLYYSKSRLIENRLSKEGALYIRHPDLFSSRLAIDNLDEFEVVEYDMIEVCDD